MTNDEIKEFIARKTEEGLSLSAIQDVLNSERNVKMTFMELRLIASEIESGLWQKKETSSVQTEKKEETSPAQAKEAAEENGKAGDDAVPAEETAAPAPQQQEENKAADKVRGKTVVTVNPIQRPGFAASGTVTFGSGSTAEWFLDQAGRLGLDNLVGEKPDRQDVMEFQAELQKAFDA